MSGSSKGSGLDIFDSLGKKAESPESGVLPRATGTKAPPPPPSLNRTNAPAPPPSLASLAAPVPRPSAAPPPPPSMRLSPGGATPPPNAVVAAPPPLAALPPPVPTNTAFQAPPPPLGTPSSSRNAGATPPPPPSVRPGPPSSRPLPPPSLPRPASVPSALNAYGGDPEDDAPTRLYSHGSTPPPPQAAPPPPAAPPTRTLPRNDRPAAPGPAAIPEFSAGPTASKQRLYIVGAAVGAAIAAAALFLGHRTGALTITVTGPGGRAVQGIQVFVDGVKRCDDSPCRVSDLSSGPHLVRAAAKGYQETADQAVSVEAGQQGTQNVSLVAAAGTGVRVSALGSGLKLYLDGHEIGELPQSAKDLTAGDHVLRVAGNDRYEPWEEHVTLDEGETRTIGPLKLRVLKGLATFKAGPGADGARVLLDGRMVPELPATIEVPAGKQLSLVATKSGYSTYRRAIAFDDGVAEKTFEITMVEGSSDATDQTAPAAPVAPAAPAPHAGTSHSAPAAQAPARPAAKGKATLNINSIPVSNVILNGRPLGPTPKVGVQVAPGPQTVVFVHPQFGRKAMSGVVNAGETKTFMVRLK